MPRSLREIAIRQQEEREQRLRRVTRGKRKELAHTGKSRFKCPVCEAEVTIRWKTLNKFSGQPECFDCGCKLVLVVACLNKGMIPKSLSVGKPKDRTGK